MSTTIQKKTYSVTITKDDEGLFIGRCDDLHANSQGESFGEVVENMKEAVGLGADELDNITDFNMLIIER